MLEGGPKEDAKGKKISFKIYSFIQKNIATFLSYY